MFHGGTIPAVLDRLRLRRAAESDRQTASTPATFLPSQSVRPASNSASELTYGAGTFDGSSSVLCGVHRLLGIHPSLL